MTTTYTGPSIVDYLSSVGQASDYNSRAALATKYGITNYSGTADQNTQLLTKLRSGTSATPAAPASPGTGATTAPNTGATTVPAPVNNTPTPQVPTIDTNGIMNYVTSGQIDPSQIDTYINNLVTKAYTTTGPTGTIIDTASATAKANEIRNQLAGRTYSYAGQNYQYAPGGSVKTSTTINNSTTSAAGTTSTTGAQGGVAQPQTQTPPPAQPAQPAAATPQTPAAQVTPPAVGAPALPANGAAGGTTGGGASSYTGPSVVDYLNSIGQASDYNSRAALAAKMGITGYTGTAMQNTQLLNSLRGQGGGNNASTATAAATGAGSGAGGSSGGGAGGNPEANSIIANATAIAKQFGWTAPDPNQSPLNIATNLFTQGLAAFGLNDLKTQINSVLEQQTKLQNEKADEAATINANPWLTEGERVSRLSKLDDKYATKLDILTHQQQLYEADYKTGLDQVQWQVGQAMTAYNAANTANDKLFSDALTVAEKVMESDAALKKEQATANKPIEVSAGNTLYDPATGKAIYTAPSKATSSLTTAATNDAAVRAGVDQETFKTYPADVQAFFSQKSDADISPIKDALMAVANGKKKAADFVAQMKKGDFGTVAPAVQTFLADQANQAEKVAPAQSGNSAQWWNPLSWF